MTQPDDFGIDLATRIALHEMLLEKLFYNVIKERADSAEALEKLRESLNRSFDVSTLHSGYNTLQREDQAMVEQQSAWGKELSDKFVDKVKRMF